MSHSTTVPTELRRLGFEGKSAVSAALKNMGKVLHLPREQSDPTDRLFRQSLYIKSPGERGTGWTRKYQNNA